MKSKLTEKLHIDFDNFNGKIVNGNFGLGSLVTVEINGKQYTRRVYDDPKTDLYIVIGGIRIYYQDFWNWNRSDEEELTEDFHSELAHEVEHEVTAGRSVKLNLSNGDYVLFTRPLDSDFGVTSNDVVRVTFFNKDNEPEDHDIYDSFADATAGFREGEWETLDEDFPDIKHRVSHFHKHCKYNNPAEFSRTEYTDDIAYEAAANKLANEPVTSSELDSPDDVIGFIQNDGAYVKYNKRTRALVKYKPSPAYGEGVKIITYYKGNPNKYKLLRIRDYKCDIK